MMDIMMIQMLKMEVILPGVLIEEENIVFLKQVHVFHFHLLERKD